MLWRNGGIKVVKDIDFIVIEKEVPNYKDYLMNTLEEFQIKAKKMGGWKRI